MLQLMSEVGPPKLRHEQKRHLYNINLHSNTNEQKINCFVKCDILDSFKEYSKKLDCPLKLEGGFPREVAVL